ncbi:MAG: general secretion pathway protein GspB [Methylomicrobium sp.]
MSYILNALRKSEQERQANQPETITEQVLMPPPQKSRKTAILIGSLLAVNLLAVPLLAWYLKQAENTPAKPQIPAPPLTQKTEQKPLPVDSQAAFGQSSKAEPAVAAPPPEAMRPQMPVAAAPAAKTPSIEDLAALKQAAEENAAKQAQHDKSEHRVQNAPSSAAILEQGQLRKEERQARQIHGILAAKSGKNSPDKGAASEENKIDTAPPSQQGIPLYKDLPYNFRNSAPKMTINVFMYADKPEDRFVILNMTKYKAGQTTKESVEIKEIRSDGVIASYEGRVFRIERP